MALVNRLEKIDNRLGEIENRLGEIEKTLNVDEIKTQTKKLHILVILQKIKLLFLAVIILLIILVPSITLAILIFNQAKEIKDQGESTPSYLHSSKPHLGLTTTRSSVALKEFLIFVDSNGQGSAKQTNEKNEKPVEIFSFNFKKFSCIPFFVFLESSLIISFFLLTGIAIHKYLETKNLWTEEDKDSPLSKDYSVFNELAIRHKKLSQLWFTISMAILCGGLIYAAFHVMKISCKDIWGFISNDYWYDHLVNFIPNLFLYSIFLIGYMWSLKNYKAHWHNFVTNEHRYASLVAIEKIRERNTDPEIQKQLDMQSAVVVLIPSETAYLEGEGKDEITAAERLLKIEEEIRELATQKEGKSK